MFDLVVPVFNAIHHVRTCLTGIRRHATMPYHLYLVDDASDSHTTEAVKKLVGEFGTTATYLRNTHNLGYLPSANLGGRQGNNAHLVLINSDTFVTPGFLERTFKAFESDPAIGVVTAMSNWANWTRICWKMPAGHNVYSLARHLEQLSNSTYPDINNASGFYFAIRRPLFDQLAGFDPVYGKGYWEEADFCMRALELDRRVVVDDGLFVFHHGWGSFQEAGRNENMEANKRIFMERWQAKYERLERGWKKHNPVSYMVPAVFTKERNHPPVFDQHHRTDSASCQARRFPISKLKAKKELDALLQGNHASPAALERHDLASITPGADRPLRVCYILPAVKVYGGIISVLQVVNQLILQGIDANIATYGEIDEAAYQLFPTLFSAYSYDSQEAMVAAFPDCDLIVATSWDSVYPATLVAHHRPGVKHVYFVQDYEPDFYAAPHTTLAERAERSYGMIPDKIAKTRWLTKKLKGFEGRVHRIPLGLNLDYFLDRGQPRDPQILALGRPQSERRNFGMVVSVFSEIHRHRPDVKLALYGFGYQADQLPFPCIDYGKLTRMEEVARALNESTILLDCSLFQGFGRPGLEAMACGTLAVLTHEGGITQYAKHDYNCRLIDPVDRENILSTLLEMLSDQGECDRLIAQGKQTAKEYSLTLEGARTAKLLTAIAAGRVDRDTTYEDWDQGADPA